MALPLPEGEGWGEGGGDARLGKGLRRIPSLSRIGQRVRGYEAESLVSQGGHVSGDKANGAFGQRLVGHILARHRIAQFEPGPHSHRQARHIGACARQRVEDNDVLLGLGGDQPRQLVERGAAGAVAESLDSMTISRFSSNSVSYCRIRSGSQSMKSMASVCS